MEDCECRGEEALWGEISCWERSLSASDCQRKAWEWGNEVVWRGAETEDCHGIAWTVHAIQTRGRKRHQEEEQVNFKNSLLDHLQCCLCILHFSSYLVWLVMFELHFPRKEKDPLKPKHPMSAYFLFTNDRRAALIAENKNFLEVIACTFSPISCSLTITLSKQNKKHKLLLLLFRFLRSQPKSGKTWQRNKGDPMKRFVHLVSQL